MKKIFFFITAFLVNLGMAQQVLIQDFSMGSSYTFASFEGLASATIVTDPVAGGTRGNGLKMVSQSSGQPWQGAEIVLTTKKVKLTTDKTMKIDVYSSQAFTMLAKVETGGPASATSASYTTPGSWQTLTFNFATAYDGTVAANGEYEKVVFFGNWKADNTGFMNPPMNFAFHVDNITGEAATVAPPAAGPSSPAPTPPGRPVADVVSIFSNAYTNIAVNEWGPNWGPSSARILDNPISGNATKLIDMNAGQVFAGIDFAPSKFNATPFTHFHVDYYIPGPLATGQVLNIKLSNHVGTGGETSAIQYTATPVADQWVQLDIPLANFVAASDPANLDRSAIAQIVITAARADTNVPVDIYFDNMYFHKNTLGVNDINAVKNAVRVYPNPISSGENLFVNKQVKNLEIINLNGQLMKVSNTNQVNTKGLEKGVYIVKVTNENGEVQTSKVIVK